ncbi:LysR substrate-binding domain-containing protein [Paracoccus methylarcula]|nr:LysR substrate-binding domain-containing protein [Paracoccus methylarcula]
MGDGEQGRRRVSLRELEVLQALVQTGTSINAARELGITQSAVSRRLAQLEARLGYPLFGREGGRLVPLVEALTISEQLAPVFAVLERITMPRSTAQNYRGHLRIAAPPTIAHRFLPARIADFCKRYPQVEVNFEVLASDSLITSIAEGRNDVGLTDTIPAHDGIRCETLLRTRTACIMPGDHRLAAQRVIRPEDLEGEAFIGIARRHSNRVAVDRVFERAGVHPLVRVEAATSVSIVELVRAGLGLSLVNPFPIVHQLGPGVVARTFEPEIANTTQFLLPSSRAPSAVTRAFIEAMKAEIETAAYQL